MVEKIKYSVVTYEDTLEDNFKEPSSWFVVGATGDRYYFHYRDRDKAQQSCDELMGQGKYVIRTNKMKQPKGNQTAVGRMNAKSRMNSKGPKC